VSGTQSLGTRQRPKSVDFSRMLTRMSMIQKWHTVGTYFDSILHSTDFKNALLASPLVAFSNNNNNNNNNSNSNNNNNNTSWDKVLYLFFSYSAYFR
jgi:hypothetical protein